MAIDFFQGSPASALEYAYFTVGEPVVDVYDDLSIFAWINPNVVPGALGATIGAVVNMPTGFGGYNKQILLIYTDGAGGTFLSAGAGDGTTAYSDHPTAITLNTWSAAGGSLHRGSIKSYLNGVPGPENTTIYTGTRAFEETIIGAYPTVTVGTFNKPWNGCMAYVTMWNIALSDAQQALLATGIDPSTVEAGNIVLHVPFLNTATRLDCFTLPATGIPPIVPDTLAFRAYNADPLAGTSTATTCATNPAIISVPEETCLPSVTFSLFKDTTFHDWVSSAADPECGSASDPANYESCLQTYYHFVDDQMLWMQAPYVYTYLDNNSRNADNPSLLMTPKWDWSEDGTITYKHGRETQVYASRPDSEVSNTKNRVRGSGRSLQLQFYSEEGKDWNLLGWGIFFDKNSRY